MTYYNKHVSISELTGKTLTKIEGAENGSGQIIFTTDENETFKMYHEQDCCEDVNIDDIIGEVSDLIGNPITMADESTNSTDDKPQYAESFTWTFYRLATVKGYVTIKWLGESNGYYSEDVSLIKL